MTPTALEGSALWNDSTMRMLFDRYGEMQLKRRSPFTALSRSIIAQQISTRAADTIRSRIEAQYGTEARRLAEASVADLRNLGVSEQKAACLREVARRSVDGDFDRLDSLADEQVVATLSAIRGVGVWTATMFLIFCLAREDVWPMADAGLREAARKLYKVQSVTELSALGDRFHPTRSLAALYLWRSLENT